MTQPHQDAVPGENSVTLRGRVSSAPVEREVTNGDTIVTFRLALARDKSPMTAQSKRGSDWVDCAAWGGRVRRSAASWRVDDIVEVEGALRRRYFRVDGRTSTRVEVEVLTGRVVARAP